MGMMDTVTTPDDGPIICTILGDAGRGKTSLAATFPNPIFIRAEDGLKSLRGKDKPKAFPVLTKVSELWDQLLALLHDEHDFKTLVIDSVTSLEALFTEDILSREKEPGRGLQQAAGGYGAGLDVLASMHRRVRKAAGLLAAKRGMNVVFTAHADTVRMEPPDSEPYMSYTLRLNKKSMPAYIDDVDIVGFLRLETYVKGKDGERKQAISDGTRELICIADAASVSKNRFDITEPLVVKKGENPLAAYIPGMAKAPAPVKPAAAKKGAEAK